MEKSVAVTVLEPLPEWCTMKFAFLQIISRYCIKNVVGMLDVLHLSIQGTGSILVPFDASR